MESILYEGKTVSFREFKDGERCARVRKNARSGSYDICPLCLEEIIEVPGTVVLVVSNQAGVPNRFIHKECMGDSTLEYIFNVLVADWQIAKKYKHWFV